MCANPSVPSHRIRAAKPTIIGAGPVGCVLALLLQEHHIPVTLIDSTPRNISFEAGRAYSFGINIRGLQVLSKFPSLLRRIEEMATLSFPLQRHIRQPDGSWKVSSFGKVIPGKNVSQSIILRHKFVSLCRDEIDTASFVTCMYDNTLEDIQVDGKGGFQLRLKSASGHVTSLDTQLLLACDGVRSGCAQLLQNVPMVSSRGLHRISFPSYTPECNAKVLIVNRDFYKSEPGSNVNDDKYAPDHYKMYSFREKYSSKRKDSVLLDIFPQSKQVIEEQGGVCAAIRAHPSHVIWRLDDVKAAMDVLEKEVPLLRPRQVVSDESMASFLSVGPLKLPKVARRASLCATCAKGSAPGAIVFIGDAAHSVPPDVGEGLNAGLQDAYVFAKTLIEGEVDDTPAKVAQRYESAREPETRAFMRFAQRALIALSRSRLDAANFALRRMLAKRFPGLFYAPAPLLRGEYVSFEEIMKRADQTTMRLFIATGLISGIVSMFILYL